jgi:uncharacterized protein YndB with AHSA1/START domain
MHTGTKPPAVPRLRCAFPDGHVPPFDGEVITFTPPQVLEFSWGHDVMRFELQPDGDSAILTLVHPLSELGRAAHDGAGWHECFELLGYELDGQTPPFEAGARWTEVLPWYENGFGPEASRLGPPQHHW